MIDNIIAYNTEELNKKEVLSTSKTLYKSELIEEEQWQKIKIAYAPNFFMPSIVVKVLLFIFSFIAMSTLFGPIALILGDIGTISYQVVSLFLGIIFIVFTEIVFIKNGSHFSSGVTEAGIYAGLSFFAFGILGFHSHASITYLIVGFLLVTFAAVRYIDILALVTSLVLFILIIFDIATNAGGVFEAGLPFILTGTFSSVYWYSFKLQKKLPYVFLNKHFIIIKVIALCMCYFSLNYFVVRELSIKLMELHLNQNEDIPFAFIFYISTALIPILYLYWGFKQRSILLIRVGLLVVALSVITFKYYFSLGMPVVTITLSGIILIAIGLVSFRYFKQMRNGFTAENVFKDSLMNDNIAAIIASQTLGGNSINKTIDNGGGFGQGSSGGGGSTSNF